MSNKDEVEAKIILEIYINDNRQLLYKLNDIATRFDVSLNVIIEKSLNKLIYDIDFIQTLRN
ncbi:hypothetical protein [Clostridium botulinum]|uniref:hypothetical protein n=1 Tax=Clostridium botulinum TaxID=1491 RepID=UPI001967E8EB|nr:hypothetical protein [Clostridium botulinum]MBN1057076.1 hypothetical protein [Clostridium botulinum]